MHVIVITRFDATTHISTRRPPVTNLIEKMKYDHIRTQYGIVVVALAVGPSSRCRRMNVYIT